MLAIQGCALFILTLGRIKTVLFLVTYINQSRALCIILTTTTRLRHPHMTGINQEFVHTRCVLKFYGDFP